MTGSSKFTWGLIINLIAGLVMLAGFGLTASIIGGCVGIPMIIAAIPFLVWGAVWIYQGQHLKAQETIAMGIQRGLTGAAAQFQPASVVAPPQPLITSTLDPGPPAPAVPAAQATAAPAAPHALPPPGQAPSVSEVNCPPAADSSDRD